MTHHTTRPSGQLLVAIELSIAGFGHSELMIPVMKVQSNWATHRCDM